MLKQWIIIFVIVLNSIQILCILDVGPFIDDYDANIVRVRTVEERDRRSSENVVLDFIGLVEQYEGYTAEEYNVTTQDGYILKLHRITGSPLSPARPGKPVICLQHALLTSSDLFVLYGPKQALAFLLADEGYDIWLGNFRGNTYSKSHVNYTKVTVHDKAFWDFSMDEMAKYDLPAFIDTILENTSKDNLTYIGYSMGVTNVLMLLSTQPEYSKKINLVSGIAPGSFFSHPLNPSLLTLSLTIIPQAETLARLSDVHQILPQSKIIQVVGKDICSSPIGRLFCGGVLRGVANHVDNKMLPFFLAYTPAGTSLKTLDHYYQMIKSGKFEEYQTSIVPSLLGITKKSSKYDLTKITTPHALYYSESDIFADPKGVKRLSNTLRNVVACKAAPDSFNHVDFAWAFEARATVYEEVLKDIRRFAQI